ncbi:type II toxin-antitoxin system RatA family toxin [Nocardia sp. NPDC057668]|uniref:type II toxin-antitoxin system RatA family toxin n=1 Tax=Nocardia sp. NPDC057668 TaxID=3346202 RepID=UPI00366BA131
MQAVQVRSAVSGWTRREVYERLKDGEVYVKYAPEQVKSVRTEIGSRPNSALTHWEIYFRNGILSWSEEDSYDDDTCTIEFTQIDGDFDVFDGAWRVDEDENGLILTFTAEFDFGVPSMESIVNPVALRVLRYAMSEIVSKLFGGTVIEGDPAPANPRG